MIQNLFFFINENIDGCIKVLLGYYYIINKYWEEYYINTWKIKCKSKDKRIIIWNNKVWTTKNKEKYNIKFIPLPYKKDNIRIFFLQFLYKTQGSIIGMYKIIFS